MQQPASCRTCDTSEINNFHHLNERIEDYPEMLADMLQEFLKVDLPDGFAEKLPQYLCDRCTQRLLDAHNFVSQARDATELLIKKLSEKGQVATVLPESLQESPMELCSEKNAGEQIVTEIKIEPDIEVMNETYNSLATELVCKDIKQESKFVDDDSLDDGPLQNTTSIDDKSEVIGKSPEMQLPCDKPFKCNSCQRTFNDITILDIHLQTHINEKILKCDLCEQTFSEHFKMQVHRRMHARKKLFQCDFCEKSFNQNAKLVRHRRMHTGEKPFKCDVCEKSFTQSSTMMRHRREHSAYTSSYNDIETV